MKKRFVSFLLILCCCVAFPLSATVSSANIVHTGASYYTPVNGYFYQLDQKIYESVDSFEAWVKLPILSSGGYIFTDFKSNYTWSVDLYGRFAFKWGNEAVHTFSDSSNIADGTWHHIALVRTPTEFTYYLDGEVESVLVEQSTPMTKEYTYNIGSTNRYDESTPLEGYIS